MFLYNFANFLLFGTVYLANASIFTPEEETDVIKFVNHVMACRNIPGLTVAVVDGSKTWTRGFGIADIESRRPVDKETRFNIGSLGKAFTATLLGSLLDTTSYDWYTRLADIDEVRYEFVTEELTRNATLADLLAHSTGLSEATDNAFTAGYPPQVTRDFLSRRLKYVPNVADLRQTFKYNNLMYMLLGDVIEKLEKGTFERLLQLKLFEPIGMISTKVSTSSDDIIKGNVAKPIIAKEKGGMFADGNYEIYKMSPLEPAGIILSNAVDMAKWMRFNLNNGTTSNGESLISGDLFSGMFQAQNSVELYSFILDLRNTTFPINDLSTAYGYAWFISTYRARRRFWHSGGLYSYVSNLWLFPDESIGIYTNVNGPGHNHIAGDAEKVIMYYIADILLKEDPWLSVETGCTFPSPWRNATEFKPFEPNPPLTPNLTEYVGYFGNRIFPDVSILQSGESLVLHMNRIHGLLRPTDIVDRFLLEITEPWEYAIEKGTSNFVKFSRDEHNETVKFAWFMDTWITFERGVHLLDGVDDPYPTTPTISTNTTDRVLSNASYFNCSTVLLITLALIETVFCHAYFSFI